MGKMILGTVQLGMPYGINNVTGQPDMEESMNILDYAYENGVDILDTASAYGDSEQLIGNYIRQNTVGQTFRICTKLPVFLSEKKICEYFEESRSKLQVDTLYVYYLHRFEQCKSRDVLSQLFRLRETGCISNIGISVYQPDELRYIIKNLGNMIDVVQIPFNLFDNVRWIKDDLLAKATEKGIKIYARSVFLQGLILSGADSSLCRKMGIVSQMKRLQDIAGAIKRPVAQLAVDYLNTTGEIGQWLIGCETLDQLKENINLCKKAKRLEKDICEEIIMLSRSIDEKVIDPRRWSI